MKRQKNENEELADPDIQETLVYQKYKNQFVKHAVIID